MILSAWSSSCKSSDKKRFDDMIPTAVDGNIVLRPISWRRPIRGHIACYTWRLTIFLARTDILLELTGYTALQTSLARAKCSFNAFALPRLTPITSINSASALDVENRTGRA